MNSNEEAKILLEYGHIESFIKARLEKFNVSYDAESYFDEMINYLEDNIDPALIKENWENNKIDLYDDGYTLDDVEYNTIHDAIPDYIDDFFDYKSSLITKMFFNKDEKIKDVFLDMLRKNMKTYD